MGDIGPDAATEALGALMARLGALLDIGDAPVFALMAVFARVGAMTALLPGFGEQTLSVRLKLAAAVAFTLVVWPAVAPMARAAEIDGPAALAATLASEAAVGVILGLAVRLVVMALQMAGTIAAQATAVSQVAGPNVTPDPMPAIGAILLVAGVALAMAAGLHVKAAVALVGSYAVIPLGQIPLAGDAAAWGAARIGDAFGLALALAAPFAAASFVYNLALGAINRAMPQLMVAFVGAPAITAGALILLAALAPEILSHWSGRLDAAIADPFGTP